MRDVGRFDRDVPDHAKAEHCLSMSKLFASEILFESIASRDYEQQKHESICSESLRGFGGNVKGCSEMIARQTRAIEKSSGM
jgi:hypothetical protein